MALVLPWTVATILCWVFTETLEEEPGSGDSVQIKPGWVVAILQSVSVFLYLAYITCAVMFIGMMGRRSVFSYCCLVAGVPVFAAVPLVSGGVLLFLSLMPADEEAENTAETVVKTGLATAVLCVFSTVTCMFMLCWALICGSKGRGKRHRYPIPLAYLPYLKDFQEIQLKEDAGKEADRYTADYPPPRHTFGERKKFTPSDWIKAPKSKSPSLQE